MNANAARPRAGRRFMLAALPLVAITLAAALILVDWRVEHIVTKVDRAAISDELDALEAIAREDGLDALQDAIRVSSRLNPGHDLRVIAPAGGAPVSGDLAAWPRGVRADNVWTRFSTLDDDGAPFDVEGMARALPDGGRLLVARDLEDRRLVHGDTLAAFAIALTTAVGLTLLIGVWLDRAVHARIVNFARTADDVMSGRLEARVPATGGDEFERLAHAINAMLDRIQTLMTGLRAVTDSLAHDLRTPLTRVTAHLERARATDAPARDAAIASALREAEHVRRTFETLIDIARAETGVSRETMETIDLAPLVTDVCELFEPHAEDKGLTLTVDAPSTFALAHRPLLSQAIGNLLDNAIKYTPAGGDIHVSLSPVAGGLDLVVQDTGPGIPEGERDAAIARFGRLARDSTAQGAGLGLSIVAAAAHLHGGRIRLEDARPGLRAVLEIRTPDAG